MYDARTSFDSAADRYTDSSSNSVNVARAPCSAQLLGAALVQHRIQVKLERRVRCR